MSFNIGDRVSVNGSSTGTIKFMGPTDFQKGEWIGIQLDTPTGKNNGSINGIRYFSYDQDKDTGQLYGVFVRSSMIAHAYDRADTDDKFQKIIKLLENKLLRLRSDMGDLNEKINFLNDENANLNNTIAILEETLERQTVNAEVVEEQNQTLKTELDKLNDAYQVLKIQFETVQTQLQTRNKLDQELSTELTKGELSDDITVLQRQNKRLEIELWNLREETTDNELLLTEQLNELESQLIQLQDIETKYIACHEQLKQLEQSNEMFQEQLNNLAESESIIENLTDKNMELIKMISELETTVKELEQLQQIDLDLDKNHTEIEDELRNDILSLNAELDAKRLEVEELKKQNSRLEELILKSKKKTQSLSDDQTGIHRNVSEQLVLNLKHENSKLLGTKSELELQTSLKLINELSIDEYNKLLLNIPALKNLNFASYFVLIKFKQLSYFYKEFFLENFKKITTITLQNYSLIAKHLKDSFVFSLINNAAEYYLQLAQYSDEFSSSTLISRIKEYIESFEATFESGNFDISLTADFNCPLEVKSRESAIKQLSNTNEQLKYCLLFIDLIQRGLILLNQEQSYNEIKNSLGSLSIALQSKINELLELRNDGFGLLKFIEFDDSKVTSLYNAILNISKELEVSDIHNKQVVNSVLTLPFPDSFEDSINSMSFDVSNIKEVVPTTWDKMTDRAALLPTSIDNIEDKGIETVNPEMIDELQMKVSILTAKLNKHQLNEMKVTELSIELENYKLHNEELTSNLDTYKSQVEQVKEKLDQAEDKLKLYGGSNDQGDLFEEFRDIEKSKLIYEISKLRDLVFRIENSKISRDPAVEEDDLSWLKQDLVPLSIGKFKALQAVEIKGKRMINELFTMNLKYSAIPITKRKNAYSQYYTNLMYEELLNYKTAMK